MNLNFTPIFSQLPDHFYTKMPAEGFSKTPQIVHSNIDTAALIGLDPKDFDHPDFPAYFSGNLPLHQGGSLAMVYSGHQFGQWAGQLGDGRALLIAQVGHQNQYWDIQLKGSGKTPYSRFGDGRAVLRSCIREYLCSEAMAALDIPTSRALCIISTGESVLRERPEPGAILTRLAPSHIRFGHFEHFFYTRQDEAVGVLADHVITHYFPELATQEKKYHLWFTEVVRRSAELVAKWQSVGFAHGVLNTDNMSILGLTLDYGPFGLMEAFDPGWICNHSDHEGRYAFDQQPHIVLWNLSALAYALSPIMDRKDSQEILNQFEGFFNQYFQEFMLQKLGIETVQEGDLALIDDLFLLMHQNQSDYTLTFRYLSQSFSDSEPWLSLFHDFRGAAAWLARYRRRLTGIDVTAFEQKQRGVNPKYVLRNWVAEAAIRAAEDHNDMTVLDQIYQILKSPFEEHPEFSQYAAPAPAHLQGLSVSCSS